MKHKIIKTFFLLFCSLLFLIDTPKSSLAATTPKPVLSHKTMTIPLQGSARLSVQNSTSRSITWSSANPEIATVTNTGIILAKSAGKTTITAKVGKTSLTCPITIYKLSTSDQTTNPAIFINSKLFYLGDPVSKITKLFGRPDRIDPTIYDFDYYVYHNKNYKYFCMIGIKDDKVVSVYTDCENFQIGNLTNDCNISEVNHLFNATLPTSTQSSYVTAHSIYYQLFFDQVEDKHLVGVLISNKDLTNMKKRTSLILKAEERELFDCCNSARVRHKIPPLIWSDLAHKSASVHCQDMIKNNYYSHISPNGLYPSERMKKVGILAKIWGENLSANYIDGITSNLYLYNSEIHRMNMLNPNFSHLGVGGGIGSTYQLYFVQNFYKKQ